jgi:hypothetical protein
MKLLKLKNIGNQYTYMNLNAKAYLAMRTGKTSMHWAEGQQILDIKNVLTVVLYDWIGRVYCGH